MPIEPTPNPQCMFCVKQFPTELKAQMKARAAMERMPLRKWLIAKLQQTLAAKGKRS